MEGDKPVPYDTNPFPGWADAVNSWKWQADTASDGTVIGWWKQGVCPRCHDSTPVQLGLVQSIDVNLTNQVFARCECDVKHADSHKGCGARAMVEGPTDG